MQGAPLFGDVGAISGGFVGVNNEFKGKLKSLFGC
jgi:hypothetical protein